MISRSSHQNSYRIRRSHHLCVPSSLRYVPNRHHSRLRSHHRSRIHSDRSDLGYWLEPVGPVRSVRLAQQRERQRYFIVLAFRDIVTDNKDLHDAEEREERKLHVEKLLVGLKVVSD
jgi:hypothetical protein